MGLKKGKGEKKRRRFELKDAERVQTCQIHRRR
jgi:hypothetical protein